MISNYGGGEMRQNIRDAIIEWPSTGTQYFLPINIFEDLLQPHNVCRELRRMLPNRSDSELEKICSLIFLPHRPARKLFAIHMYGSPNYENIILDLLAEGIADKDLPFIRINTMVKKEYRSNFTLGRNSHAECTLKDHNKCGIKALKDWKTYDLGILYRAQWLVLAPVFETSTNGIIPHMDLDGNCLLPFVKDDDEDELCGGYSRVRKVIIHHAHHNFHNAHRNEVSFHIIFDQTFLIIYLRPLRLL
jgi:hypothetical protein